MVIIIKKGTPEAAIRQLLAQLSMQNVKGGCVAGAESILLPLVGETWRLDPNVLQALPFVQEVRRLTPPYRLAGRAAHPADTVVSVGDARIGEGFLILLGVTHEDTEAQAVKLADKLMGLRIFEDENEKMNRSLTDVGGELLVVSQFTLYANCKKGRRPEFLAAARPEVAIPLYEKFVQLCRDKGFHTETGEFGAYMQVDSLNDGPLTIILDTDTL